MLVHFPIEKVLELLPLVAGKPHTHNVASAGLDLAHLVQVFLPSSEHHEPPARRLDDLLAFLVNERKQPARELVFVVGKIEKTRVVVMVRVVFIDMRVPAIADITEIVVSATSS